MEKSPETQTFVLKLPGYLGKQKCVFPKLQLNQPFRKIISLCWNEHLKIDVGAKTVDFHEGSLSSASLRVLRSWFVAALLLFSHFISRSGERSAFGNNYFFPLLQIFRIFLTFNLNSKKCLYFTRKRGTGNTSNLISRKMVPIYKTTDYILVLEREVDPDYFNETSRTF